MAERLYVRLEGDSTHGPESTAPAGTMRAARLGREVSRYASSVVVYREHFGEQEVLERVLPDGAVRLVFNLGDAPSPSASAGQQLEAIGACAAPVVVRLRGSIEGVSVTLRAGAARAVLGMPAGELEGQAVHLDELWQGAASELLERMAEAPNDQTRLDLLEQTLLQRIQSDDAYASRRAMRAAQLIASSGGNLTLRSVAEQMGIGERRLQQLFVTHVGLAPRTFSRVSRLHACLRALRGQPAPRWTKLALDAGYYDQAHLANEFRALCGLSPTSFLAATSGSSKTPR